MPEPTESEKRQAEREAKWGEYWADVKAGKRGGPDAPTYGAVTGARLGLQGEQYLQEDYLNKLREYGAYMANNPDLQNRLRYWARGAQMGLSPQAYVALEEQLRLGNRDLSGVESYLYGRSDAAPEGFQTLTPSKAVGMGGGAGGAQDWFKREYPKTSRGGYTSSSAARYPDSWINTMKYPQRIRTVKF